MFYDGGVVWQTFGISLISQKALEYEKNRFYLQSRVLATLACSSYRRARDEGH